MVIGRGSNLLGREGGIPGCAIHLVRGGFGTLKVNGTEIEAGAGVRLKQLVGAARNAEVGGFEWMEGIRGSVGGSLRMNAGRLGLETCYPLLVFHLVHLSPPLYALPPLRLAIP